LIKNLPRQKRLKNFIRASPKSGNPHKDIIAIKINYSAWAAIDLLGST